MKQKLLLGSHTHGKSEGLYTIDFVSENGTFEGLTCLAELEQATYQVLDKENQRIFTAKSTENQGGVAVYHFNNEGKLELLDEVLEEGPQVAHLSYDPHQEILYVVNYTKGNLIAYSVDSSSKLTEKTRIQLKNVENHDGSVTRSHPHHIQTTPDGKFVVVCDLGTDTLISYRWNEEGILQEVDQMMFSEGFGARQIVFHPTLEIAYVLGAKSNEIATLEYDSEAGSFNPFITMTTLPEEYQENEESYRSSALRLTETGDYAYVTNRGYGSIAIYKIHPQAGATKLVDIMETPGNNPMELNFDTTGEFVFVGYVDEDYLSTFKRNKETGKLELTDIKASVHDVTAINVM